MKRFVRFISRFKLNDKIFQFNKLITIESMLKTFLKLINLNISLDPKDIIFMYNSRILNTEKYLHKKVSDIFRNVYGNYNIKVIECGNIVCKPSIGDTFIKFEDYKCYFKLLHKKISEFFDEYYSDLKDEYLYKNNFINFINSLNIDKKDKDTIINGINKIKLGTAQEFIKVYTGETILCYLLNKYLRKCDENEYEKIKYFAGPFSYSLYKYAFNNLKIRVNSSKTFYREMVIKYNDYEKYKNNIGELICFPSFTFVSEKDTPKYNFPTVNSIKINNIKSEDIYVVLIIEYKCDNSSYETPCINVSYDSVNPKEKEYIFPPFSFFRITKIIEGNGKKGNPHIIYMNVPKKRSLIEFNIKNNKEIYYDKNENVLYLS